MKTALITGAAGGIGQALCEEFREAGYRVVGTDLREASGCDAFVQMDLDRYAADEEYASAKVDALREAVGPRLDVLVNNAALQILGSTEEISRADWRSTLRVNVTAPFLLVQDFQPELEEAEGSVINISSIHAELTKPRFVAYATSKAALSGMTRALAVDLGGGVRVNAIAPAAVDTQMLRDGFAEDPTGFKELEAHHPVGRVGTPREVARLAMQCTQGIRFLHGAVIPLDGGIAGRLHDSR